MTDPYQRRPGCILSAFAVRVPLRFMRGWLLGILCLGCAATPVLAPAPPPPPAPPVAEIPLAPPVTTSTLTAQTSTLTETATGTLAACPDLLDALEDEGVAAEEEIVEALPSGTLGPRYTTELTDDLLAELWKNSPESLGSVSVGLAHEGRLINGVDFPKDGDGAWIVNPGHNWGTEETVAYVIAAAQAVKAQYPDAFPLRINELSAKDGGYVRPHRSHQNGRDVDLGLYYPVSPPPRVREREKYIELAHNWALIKALATLTDVQVILLDKRVQKVIYDYALTQGEDPNWLDNLFKSGRNALIQHAPRHRDHFHVRFYNPRAQELAWRLAPHLAQRPEHNVMTVRVRYGNTLGGFAQKYGSSIRAIQKANRMKGTFLRVGQVLQIPLRGPCTRCPVPPPVEVPPRRLPPMPNSPSGLGQIEPVVTSTESFSSIR